MIYDKMLNCQGHAYNTFPKMGNTWIPDDVFSMKPLIRNFFENTSTVQVTPPHKVVGSALILLSCFHFRVVQIEQVALQVVSDFI